MNEVQKLRKAVQALKSELDKEQQMRLKNLEMAKNSEARSIDAEKFAKESIEARVAVLSELNQTKEKLEKAHRLLGEKTSDYGEAIFQDSLKVIRKIASVNIIALAHANGIQNPESMTLAETKKLQFAFKNVFQELNAAGE